MILGLAGSIAMQEMARLAMKSLSGNQLAALLVDFQTPPSTPPAHKMLVFEGCTRMARTRPPILPGPSQVQPEGWMPAMRGDVVSEKRSVPAAVGATLTPEPAELNRARCCAALTQALRSEE